MGYRQGTVVVRCLKSSPYVAGSLRCGGRCFATVSVVYYLGISGYLVEGIMVSTALPLVRTKLTVPPPRSHILPRQRLLASAPEAGVRLVLVEAPAGFGKTTLLASWCHALGAQGDTAVA